MMFGFAIGNLSALLAIPVIGAGLLLLVPRRSSRALFSAALIVSAVNFLWSVKIFGAFDGSSGKMQFVERIPWMPSFGIEYIVGIDGISLFLVLLTTLLMPIAILASWSVKDRVKEYLIFMLLLETGMLGAFVALDLFLFYVFWEVMLVPMYFLIGVWGGTRRVYAALKFVIYTMAGSLLMLVAIIYLATRYAQEQQALTFDLLKLYTLHLPVEQQTWLFLAFALSFAIKVPLFPFHTWLPDAHVEAPTAISVILAGVLLKMGTYGILRINYPMLPAATADLAFWFLGVLGAWNIIYGALCAMAQKDLKKLVAYSSVSHMGYVMLGMASFTTQGINGAVLQMFNHGTITGMLFLLVGVIYDRAHHRDIEGFGGMAAIMPVYTGVTALAFFASMGLPGLSGFISEILVLLGTWQKYPILTIFGASGVILTAGYLLWTIQRVYLGPPNEKYLKFPEISGREMFTLVPLGVIVIIVGIYPSVVLDMLRASLDQINQIVIPHL